MHSLWISAVLCGNKTCLRNSFMTIVIQWFKMPVKTLLLSLVIVEKSLQIIVLIHSCMKCYNLVFQYINRILKTHKVIYFILFQNTSLIPQKLHSPSLYLRCLTWLTKENTTAAWNTLCDQAEMAEMVNISFLLCQIESTFQVTAN